MSVNKKKRVSKKKKISWRKHVNITDVEEFLEDKRLEERLGPCLTTLPNDNLFTIDVKPSENELTNKQRKKLILEKPLKCFSMLQPHTKIPDPITKRNRVRTKEERKNYLIKKKEAENRAKGILKAKELQSIRDRNLSEIKRQNRPKKDEFNVDVWNSNEKFAIENDEWASNCTKKHNLRGIGKLRKTTIKSVGQKVSVIPAVETPHPGMSYNPSFKDHQDLLRTIADEEKKIIKQEKHIDRVTRGMFQKVTEEKRDSAWLEEMSQGLTLTLKGEKIDNEESTDDEYKTVNPPVRNLKKTLKQKRKQKEQRKLELMKKSLKVEKKKITDIHQLKLLRKQINQIDKRIADLTDKRKEVKLIKEKQTKRLGRFKFVEADLDFNLSEDIAGNLRNLKKEGNLLRDRYISMQKRNIVQPSVKTMRKKAKVKKYTKPGHKEDWIKTVAR